MAPRYCIGIDLGTTNCVLAYLPAGPGGPSPQVLPVPQWEGPASLRESVTFPSFAYLTTEAERPSAFADPRLPLPDGWVPGLFARARLAETPGRVIHSAKSWLSHAAVDRTAAILPWQSAEIPPEGRLSPVAASALYLGWLRDSWNAAMAADDPEAAFAAQEVVVTVPASFDEAAQELTLDAARQAGYPATVRLLEEPQAAFYDWLGYTTHRRQLLDLLERTAGRPARVLVCDIGGGTTDFSLFEVAGDRQAPGGLGLRRLAVSDHLLLGGDNIDLTLAYRLEERLTAGGPRLSGRQLGQLLAQARELKERILGAEEATPTYTVSLAGSGAGLVAGARTVTLAASEVREVVLEGFFPVCEREDRPRQSSGGLREWGLPYAADTAVTRHLAAFLEGEPIDALLFNGGTVTPLFLRQRLHRLLTDWQNGAAPAILATDAPALAVARGAARYAWLLAHPQAGGRIAGGHAHALYLEVVRGRGKERSLVCVLPRGLEAGQSVRIDNAEFDLRVNQPVRFQPFFSARRQGDRPGGVIAWNDRDFRPLPSLETAIHLPPERPRPANNRLRVTLEAALTELGLLQLWCVEEDGPGRWRLDFNLRRGLGEEAPAVQAAEAPLVPERQLREADLALRALYGKKMVAELPEVKPRQLLRRLEQLLGGPRESWDGATLRALWPTLAAGMGRRGRTPDHEESWLYLAGWLLRPGYGFPLDEARMEELWHLFAQGMVHPGEKRVQVQWWLLWRRTAGGLHAARQEKILEKILPALRGGELLPEMIYLAGALERLRPEKKQELVRLFAKGLQRPRVKSREPYAWALGRLLARVLLYAGPEAVLPPAAVRELYTQTRELDWRDPTWRPLLPLFAQGARLSGVRDLDLEDELRQEIASRLREGGALPEQVRVVRELVPVADEDRARQFGETLPAGLILIRAEG
ncbi:MAG: Hsp70 family protein [Desulfuromonadales bacterium]|nr:Hsp70 family protein [Desulfuromonadales bacterium]